MASAVAEARRVLKPSGLLLDIHPNDEPSRVEVWHAQYALNAEALPENLEAIVRAPVGELEQADDSLRDFTATNDALAEALERGFTWINSIAFDYRYFFDSLDELTEYLEDNWEHATASESLLERALMEMSRAPAPPKVVVIQRTVVTALRKI